MMRPLVPTLTRIEALQLIALGAMLANKELRSKIKPSMFAYHDFQVAASEILDGTSYTYLSRILKERANVPWEASRESPIDPIFTALERDGRFAATIDVLNEIIKDACDPECVDYRKDEFVDRILSIEDAVFWERQRADDPMAAIKHEEERLKKLDSRL